MIIANNNKKQDKRKEKKKWNKEKLSKPLLQ